MIRLNTTASFLGLDLRKIKRDWALALQQMVNWPILRWLTPVYATRVTDITGVAVDYVEKADRSIATHQQAGKVRFQGLLLPDAILLWHPMIMPRLDAGAAYAAMALQARNLSPFRPDDEIWRHTPLKATADGFQTQLVIASAKLIAKYVASVQTSQPLQNPELWVQTPDSGGFLVLDGFGEQSRRRLVTRWRWVNLCLVFCLVGTGFAAAVTPTAQLRLRAIQAQQDFSQLQALAAPAVQQRERLVQLDEQIKALQAQMLPRIQPELVLLTVTQLLGDDTYLTNLQIQGSKVILAGQTSNTAALMQQLGAQAPVKNVKSPTASYKQMGTNRETFNIEFTLETPSVPPKP